MTRETRYAVLLVSLVAITRFAFRSHYLYDIDSVDFGLALDRFDPATFQPHPPGYYLYIMLARAVSRILPDANSALSAVSIMASCGAAWMIYLVARTWYGSGAGLTSIALFLVSPLCWFHGTVALTYIVEAFFSALIGYWCWKVYTGDARYTIPASAALAAAAGFRPSAGVLLGLLWLVSLWRSRGIQRWLAAAVLVAGIVAWFIPMAIVSGGVNAYFGSLLRLWLTVPAKRTALSDPWLAVGRFLTILWIFVMCYGAASLAIFRKPGEPRAGDRDRQLFIWFWIAPGLLFFTFVFLNYVNSGYLLVLCPPVFACLSDRVYRFISAPSQQVLRRSAMAAGVAANCAFFLFAPVYCSHRGVREFERDLRAILNDFHDVTPENTLLIGFDSHFLGYRHAGYYLPKFVTVQYPEVSYPGGNRVFVMHNRDTQVLRNIPSGHFERFIFFPLPHDPEYTAYLEKLRLRFPKDTFQVIEVGNRKVWSGPAWVLPLLFETTAARS